MTTDEQIGRNLVRLRGGMSQKDLADRMRTHGFKWSQATVWAIEKGERPLRLTESLALGKIFGIDGHALTSTRFDRHLEILRHEKEMNDISDVAYGSFAPQLRIARSLDEDGETEGALSPGFTAQNAVDFAMEGLARAAFHHRAEREMRATLDGVEPEPDGDHVLAFLAHISHQVRTLGLHVREEAEREWRDVLDQAES
jgi:transcriptional regulator with XRE-family HTH domain